MGLAFSSVLAFFVSISKSNFCGTKFMYNILKQRTPIPHKCCGEDLQNSTADRQPTGHRSHWHALVRLMHTVNSTESSSRAILAYSCRGSVGIAMAGNEREGIHTDIWAAGPPTAEEKLEVSAACCLVVFAMVTSMAHGVDGAIPFSQ